MSDDVLLNVEGLEVRYHTESAVLPAQPNRAHVRVTHEAESCRDTSAPLVERPSGKRRQEAVGPFRAFVNQRRRTDLALAR